MLGDGQMVFLGGSMTLFEVKLRGVIGEKFISQGTELDGVSFRVEALANDFTR